MSAPEKCTSVNRANPRNDYNLRTIQSRTDLSSELSRRWSRYHSVVTALSYWQSNCATPPSFATTTCVNVFALSLGLSSSPATTTTTDITFSVTLQQHGTVYTDVRATLQVYEKQQYNIRTSELHSEPIDKNWHTRLCRRRHLIRQKSYKSDVRGAEIYILHTF